MILESAAAIVAGFALLAWGADRFVVGAAATARNLGVSPLIVGLTIVGFGTSAPEMLVSVVASWQGQPGLAIGNAIGSNITNVALVLGVAAIVRPLVVRSEILRRELPILILVMVLGFALILDGELNRGDGLMLVMGLAVMIYWVVGLGLRSRRTDPISREFDHELPRRMSTKRALAWLAVGLLVLSVSSRILVWGAVNVATTLGVSDLVIGLSIVAVGTSLPELAAAVTSALKNEHDIAIGNVIGSNMFNLLGVMAMPGLFAPGAVSAEVLDRDYPLMIALTVGLFLMAYGVGGRPGRINRLEGAALCTVFVAYLYTLYRMAL